MNHTEQSFAAMLEGLASAASREAAIRVATQAASSLAAIDGLCLCARAARSHRVALAPGPQIYACETLDTNLPRLVARATGQSRPIGMTMVVAPSVSSAARSP